MARFAILSLFNIFVILHCHVADQSPAANLFKVPLSATIAIKSSASSIPQSVESLARHVSAGKIEAGIIQKSHILPYVPKVENEQLLQKTDDGLSEKPRTFRENDTGAGPNLQPPPDANNNNVQNESDSAKDIAPENYVLPFGKYKGKRLREVPEDYIRWLRSAVFGWPALDSALARLPPPEGGASEERQGVYAGEVRLEVGVLFSRWGLPRKTVEAYDRLGIKRLFEWQRECLEDTGAMSRGCNLLYSAPTSGGKTLVSEILMLRATLVQRKKAMFVVPFVSIVVEKVAQLLKVCEGCDVRVQGYYANSGASLDLSSEYPEIAVCTIEKGNGLVNRLLEDERLGTLGCLVVDEAHMVGEPGRGGLLEMLVTKVLCAGRAQVVCMSATIPNLDALARWLRATVYRTAFRPVPLTHNLVIGDAVYRPPNDTVVRRIPRVFGARDPDMVGALCREAIDNKVSVLVFCASKWASESCARLLATLLPLPPPTPHAQASPAIPGPPAEQAAVAAAPEASASGAAAPAGATEAGGEAGDKSSRAGVIEELGRLPTGADSALVTCVRGGVGIHHAGLTVEERSVVEGGFTSGALPVLVATSTLAAGVNLPAGRVIIRTPYVATAPLDAGRYKQMCGRAGRTGKEKSGDSFLLVKPGERALAERIMDAPQAAIGSFLAVRRALLEAIVARIASSRSLVDRFLNTTLHRVLLSTPSDASSDASPPCSDASPASARVDKPSEAMAGGKARSHEAVRGDAPGRGISEAPDKPMMENRGGEEQGGCGRGEGQPLADEAAEAMHWLHSRGMIRPLPPAPPGKHDARTAAAAEGGASPAADAPARPGTVPLLQSPAPAARGGEGESKSLAGVGYRAADAVGCLDAAHDASVAAVNVGGGVNGEEAVWEATELGEATVASGLSPEQALLLYGDLSRARGGLILHDELHLLYLLVPHYHGIQPSWKHYWKELLHQPPLLARIARAIGVSLAFVDAMAHHPARKLPPNPAQPPAQWEADVAAGRETEAVQEARQMHGRFWAALMLRLVILEVPLPELCSRFQVQRGQIQGLQGMAATYAGMVATFCGKVHWWQLQVLATSFQHRLEAGAQPDILPLTRLPQVKTFRARALFRAGIRTLNDLAAASLPKIESILRSVAPARLTGPGARRGGKSERAMALQIQQAAREMLVKGVV